MFTLIVFTRKWQGEYSMEDLDIFTRIIVGNI